MWGGGGHWDGVTIFVIHISPFSTGIIFMTLCFCLQCSITRGLKSQ